MEELEGVLSNLFWGGFLFALGARGDHARLKEDAFEHDIVLGQVEEHLSPHVLRYLECPLNPMLSVKEDFGLDYRNQSIILTQCKQKFAWFVHL